METGAVEPWVPWGAVCEFVPLLITPGSHWRLRSRSSLLGGISSSCHQGLERSELDMQIESPLYGVDKGWPRERMCRGRKIVSRGSCEEYLPLGSGRRKNSHQRAKGETWVWNRAEAMRARVMKGAEGHCPGGTQARNHEAGAWRGERGRGSQGFSNGRMLIFWPLNSVRFYFGGLQNNHRWWLQPWN